MFIIKSPSTLIKQEPLQRASVSSQDDSSSRQQFEKLMQPKKKITQQQEQAHYPDIAQPLSWLPGRFVHLDNDLVASVSPERTTGVPVNLTAVQPMTLPDISPLSQIDAIQTLYLRIAKGPLAGLVLQATVDKKSIQLRLATSDYQNHSKIKAQQGLLNALFGQDLDQTLFLENTHGKHNDE
jgi:hypothetical protein